MKRLSALLILALSPVLFSATAAAYNPLSGACQAGSNQSVACDKSVGKEAIAGPGGVIDRISKIIAVIAGISSVIIIIISGLIYVTSGGDPKQTATARSTIIYAAVGLIVIVLAQSILMFVVDRI